MRFSPVSSDESEDENYYSNDEDDDDDDNDASNAGDTGNNGDDPLPSSCLRLFTWPSSFILSFSFLLSSFLSLFLSLFTSCFSAAAAPAALRWVATASMRCGTKRCRQCAGTGGTPAFLLQLTLTHVPANGI